MAKKERIIIIITFVVMAVGIFMAFIDILFFLKARAYQIAIGDPSINYKYMQDAVIEIIVSIASCCTGIYLINDYNKSVKLTNMLAFYRSCMKENILDVESSTNRVKASKLAKRFKYVEDFSDIKVCFNDAKELYEDIQEIRLIQSGKKELFEKLKEDSAMLYETSQYKDFIGASKREAIYKDKEKSHDGKNATLYHHMAEQAASKHVREDVSSKEIFEHLAISKITSQVTDAGSITIGADILPDQEIILLEDGQPGVIDGSLIATITVNNDTTFSAYLVLPVDGLDGSKTHRLGGIAFDVSAQKTDDIKVTIHPNHLWVMEK